MGYKTNSHVENWKSKNWERINQEDESTYIVYSNFHRDHITSFVSCPGIVVFAECHNVDTFRTEGWSHRRRRSSFPSLQSQLNHPRHCNSQEKKGQKKYILITSDFKHLWLNEDPKLSRYSSFPIEAEEAQLYRENRKSQNVNWEWYWKINK